MSINTTVGAQSMTFKPPKRRWPPELSIFLVLIGISLFFEALGWALNGQSFLFNLDRLQIIILQMAVIGIIAVGVNLVIITSGIECGGWPSLGQPLRLPSTMTAARAAIPALTWMAVPPAKSIDPRS